MQFNWLIYSFDCWFTIK